MLQPPALCHTEATLGMEGMVTRALGCLAAEETTCEMWPQAPVRLPSASPLVVLKQLPLWCKEALYFQGSPGKW